MVSETTIAKLTKDLSEENTRFIKEQITSQTLHRIYEADIDADLKTKIVRSILTKDYTNIFRTRKARELLTQLLTKIRNKITTRYGKEKVLTFLPTIHEETILNRQERITSFIDETKDKDLEYCSNLFVKATNLSYNPNIRHNGIAIAIADEDFYNTHKSKLAEKFYITLIESEHDLLSIDHYEQIRFVKGERHDLNAFAESIPQSTIFSENDDLETVAPECVTDIIDENKSAIEAIYALSKEFDFSTKLPELPALSETDVSLTHIEQEMSTITKNLEIEIQKTISEANFEGKTIMEIISQQQSIITSLDNKSQERINDAKEDAYDTIRRLIPNGNPQLLIEIDHLGKVSIAEQELQRSLKELSTIREEQVREGKSAIARNAKELVDNLPSIVEEIHSWEVLTGITLFIKEHDLERPEIVDKGISFVYGRNMNIKDAIPVEYYIGKDQNTSVLTGANSGGKTTLLELTGHMQILAQMGLFVPAKLAKVGIVDELHYFSKNKGSLNAGAFETLLKQFATIANDESRKLILADEIESVTEPDVAAKIIKGIIDHVNKSPANTMILVTHMGRELETLDVATRFDGIEAKGLDKDLNLVVDRNPIIGRIARSTPQLIIERMAKTNEDEFYKDIYKLLC